MILELDEITIFNVYCSQNKEIKLSNLPTAEKKYSSSETQILNSHSTNWGCGDLDSRSKHIEDCLIENNILKKQ